MDRINKLLGSEFENSPEKQKEMCEVLAYVSKAIHDAYRELPEIAGPIFAAIFATAFLGVGDDVDAALALNGKMYADVRKAIVSVDKVLSTGEI